MTSDELRQQCIDAMEVAADNALPCLCDKDGHPISPGDFHAAIEAAFDAMHGLVRLEPPEATPEMIEAGAMKVSYPAYSEAGRVATNVWRVMAAAGDLTRPG